jgi:hypothetical protein
MIQILVGILLLLILVYLLHSKYNLENFKQPSIDYYILTRNIDKNMINVYNNLIPQIKFISDDKPTIIDDTIFYYDDSIIEKQKFLSMHSKIKITAWDKMIYHLSKKNDKSYYWIIEDDVFLNTNIKSYLDSFNNDDSDMIIFGWYKEFPKPWAHWNKNKFLKKKILTSSLNTIIRCSNKLIKKILEYKKKYESLLFHEILFGSIARQYKLKIKIVNKSNIFNSAFKDKKFKSNKLEYYDSKKNFIIKHPLKKWYNL